MCWRKFCWLAVDLCVLPLLRVIAIEVMDAWLFPHLYEAKRYFSDSETRALLVRSSPAKCNSRELSELTLDGRENRRI